MVGQVSRSQKMNTNKMTYIITIASLQRQTNRPAGANGVKFRHGRIKEKEHIRPLCCTIVIVYAIIIFRCAVENNRQDQTEMKRSEFFT